MEISRREALRLGGTSTLGVLTAGCTSLGGKSGTDTTDDIETVPAGVSAVAHADVATLLDDDAVRRVVDAGLAPLLPWEDGGSDAESQSALAALSTRTDLDPADAETAVGFAKYRPDTDRRYVGLRIDSNWSAKSFVDAVEQADFPLTRHTYRDRPLYESGDAGPSLGVIDDGSYAFGTPPAVRAAMDVDAGILDPVDGDLRRRLAATRSLPFGAAARVPDELPFGTAGIGGMVDPGQFVALTSVTGKAYRDDDGVGAVVRLHAESAADAEDVKATVDGALAGARSLTADGDTREALGAVTVDRSASTVVVEVSGPADVAVTVVEGAAEFLAGVTGVDLTDTTRNAGEP